MLGRVQSGGRIVSVAMRQGLGLPVARVSIAVPTMEAMIDRYIVTNNHKTSTPANYLIQYRNFSTAPIKAENNVSGINHLNNTNNNNSKMPSTSVLTVDAVKRIMEELRSIDNNSDERINTDELKQLLSKHNTAFTEQEIVEIGELFYAGKSGGSVSFRRFVEAIDRVLQADQGGQNNGANPLQLGGCGNEYLFYKSRGNYTAEELHAPATHKVPETFRDKLAYNAVQIVRMGFDKATGWNYNTLTPRMVLNRTIFLETIAGVPGMVAAIVRHFRSLRNFSRDNGMMQMFLDEANNERMHLLTFVRMKDPGLMFRIAVIGGQVTFGTAFLITYMISPKFCHRFVGYIEEEAVSTYSKIIDSIEQAPNDSSLAAWRSQIAPSIARSYWKLGEDGTVLDMMYAIRADEAEHRDVNHHCSQYEEGAPNPVFNTEEKLNKMLLKYVREIMDRDNEAVTHKNVGAQ